MPWICGTIVKPDHRSKSFYDSKKQFNFHFHRKLKMMRADIFSLLSVSNSNSLLKDQNSSTRLKKSLIKYLESDYNARADELFILELLTGWNRVLH